MSSPAARIPLSKAFVAFTARKFVPVMLDLLVSLSITTEEFLHAHTKINLLGTRFVTIENSIFYDNLRPSRYGVKS